MAIWKTLLLPGVFGLLFVAEQVVPLRRRKSPLARRLAVNLVMAACVLAVGSLAVRSVGLLGANWTESRNFGLCSLLPLPPWLGIVLGFGLMDLTFYYWHRANHVIPLLWRFHNVHHIDPDLDVSTSFRFHFVEIGYSTLFRIVQVVALGVTPLTYVIYETVFAVGTMFHHANVCLPYRLERRLNKVFVTPRMHGVHHSAVRAETDSNYSVVFSWWDRLHRTLVLNVRQGDIRIGVPAYQRREDNALGPLIRMPFGRQRAYWCHDDGTPAAGHQADEAASSQMLP
ncbi:MAG: sterol desaturase family protein [Sedimentisphaerales bacterium]|nr:sterol desaturase family protein [Sedimentisphaerales bacterium]